jgi:hypothetical protein
MSQKPHPSLTTNLRDDAHAAEHAAPPVHEPPPPSDAGEPMGAKDAGRPPMLGSRFRRTMVIGMLAGLLLALLGQAVLSQLWVSRETNGWSWILAGIGGIAVGGALTLFIYGVSTDRTDTGPKRRGVADVSIEGEDRRSRRRRRRNARKLAE